METPNNNTFHCGYRLAIEHVRTSMHRALGPSITLYMNVVLDHVLNDFEYRLHDRPAGGGGAPVAVGASPGGVAQALVGTAVQSANVSPTSSELGGRVGYEPRRVETAKHVAPANPVASTNAAFKAAPARPPTTPTNPTPTRFGASAVSSCAGAPGTITVAASEIGPIVLSPASSPPAPSPAPAYADGTATFVPLSAAEYAVANNLIDNRAGKILLPWPRLRPVTMRVQKAINVTRPVNLEAVLAQSRGVRAERECGPCSRGNGPFTECVVVPGMLRDSCSNCHYNHTSQRCTFRAAPAPPLTPSMKSPAEAANAGAGSPAQKVLEDDAEPSKKRKFDHERWEFIEIKDDE
ncbi:uncharacterized protein H6S33_001987 [Morchella sextelata]|uniref:uncharacterized protein n=1 Tax=Morchella sextelata TaxID=1174677 RepID=UPI001D056A28|nr:uncharacterized protein H6S33_001987 [Morchella sextelata]KAH0607935.1 hypothetical protein H6S33_001987 [Morchella sextelata]